MNIKRKTFLKGMAATGALFAVNGPIFNSLALAKTSSSSDGKWLPTSCQGCTTWCPAEVFVQNGRAVKVKGNRYSKQNDGVLCPKGHLALKELYDPDRVKVPMKRTNPKKGKGVDPKFVPISWDEALNTIADKMMELRKMGSPKNSC